jgi:hypothetical protein
MLNMPDPKQLAAAIATFQEQIAKAQSLALNESRRKQLNELAGKFQEASAVVLAAYPSELAKLQQRQEATRNGAKAIMDKVAQLRQQTAEAKKASKAPPPPPEPIDQAIEPALGQKLRAELLELLGGAPHSMDGTAPGEKRESDQQRFPPRAQNVDVFREEKETWR